MQPYYCKLTVISILITFCDCKSALINNNLDNSFERYDKNVCIIKVIEKIKHFTPIIDITLMNIKDDLLRSTLNKIEGIRFTTRSFLFVNNTMYNSVYIINSEDYDELRTGIDLAKRELYWNPRAKFIVVIDKLNGNLKRVSDLFLNNNVFNVSVIATSGEGNHAIYAFTSNLDSCNKPKIKILQYVSHCADFNQNTSLFSIIPSNKLNGCNLKFISHNYWPFTTITDPTRFGIEKVMLKILRQFGGIQSELIDFGEPEHFGQVLDNYTHTGMLREVELNKVDGAIGGYVLLLSRAKALDFAYPYLTDLHRAIIPRARLLEKWQAVFAQISFTTILLTFVMFAIFCVLAETLTIFTPDKRHISRDVFIVISYFLNNISVKIYNTGTVQRVIGLNLLIFIFIISCAIQASLLSATTRPVRAYQVKDLNDVYAEYEFIMALDREYILNKVAAECSSTLDCMMTVKNTKNKKLFTVVSDIYYDHYIWRLAEKDGTLEVYKVIEPVNTFLLTIYFRRGSTVLEVFNKYIKRANNAGILQHYLLYMRHMDRLKYHFHQRLNQPLQLNELKEIFITLSVGYCLAIATFIVEFKIKKGATLFKI